MVDWNVKEYRFVAILDVLGFKDLVQKSNHEDVMDKLWSLKQRSSNLDNYDELFVEEEFEPEYSLSKSFTFSDTIIIFTKSYSYEDALKILAHSLGILDKGFGNNIPIKGAISYGETSVNEEESLFFGEPLINAHLLHDELEASAIILDHNAENRIKKLLDEDINKDKTPIDRYFKQVSIPLKSGNITHSVAFAPGWKDDQKNNDFLLGSIDLLYQNTSGKHRRYIDNTKRLYQSLLQE